MHYFTAFILLLMQGILPPILNSSIKLSVPSAVPGGGTSDTISVTAGQALIATGDVCWSGSCSAGSSGTLNTPTDTLGNTWTCPTAAKAAVVNGRTVQVCYVCSSASSGTDAVTFTTTGGTPNFLTSTFNNVTFIATTSCEDTTVTNNHTLTGANPTVTSAGNAAQSSEFMFGAASSGAITATSQTLIIAVSGGETNTSWTTGPASGSPQTMTWTAVSHQYYAVILGLKHQ